MTLQAAEKLVSINIIDRHGMSETISERDRLVSYEKTNFLTPQPYQKVYRTFARDKQGASRQVITTYHPNGGIKQYLEAVNHRAFGPYYEWHSNGTMKIEATLIGGPADLSPVSQEAFVFDGKSRAWNEEGVPLAEIFYSKGELEGESYYFHKNLSLWKVVPYRKNQIHGAVKIYLDNGALFQTTEYAEGLKDGSSIKYWQPRAYASVETYHQGLLKEGRYFDKSGSLISEVKNSKGQRCIFGKEGLQELQEIKQGIQEGLVKCFDEDLMISSTHSIKNGEKEGEEITYFPKTTQPKLLLTWKGGILQGPVKTWYPSGSLETQKELSQNCKDGLSTAWYANGSLMFVEEYENDKLIKGEYYRLGDKGPVSKIEKGKGIATLFDHDGNITRKITYQHGMPNG